MSSTSVDFAAYKAKHAAFRRMEEEVAPANKAALFEALASAGIHTVVVTFDGCGDAGQIENLDAFTGDNVVTPLPGAPVAFTEVVWDGLRVLTQQRGIGDVIETMANAFLEQTHEGWEDGDGAYGEFTFTVDGRTITLEYNERHMESDYHCHEF